jgi:hypothetical protein
MPGRDRVRVYDLSFNLYRGGLAAMKGGSYDVALTEFNAGRPSGNEKRVPLAA